MASIMDLENSFFAPWGLVHLVSGTPSRLRPSKKSVPMPFPRRLAIGLGACFLFTVFGTEVWYRAHEAEETCRWSIEWAFAKRDFSDLVIPKPAADILRFDEGRATSWVEGDGSRWTAFFLKWVAGPSRSGTLARGHRPEVCLPASGYQLRAGRGTITVEGYGLESGTFGPGSQDSNPSP
jgi:hypothetical protein